MLQVMPEPGRHGEVNKLEVLRQLCDRIQLRRCMATDLMVLAAAIGFYIVIVIAADNIASWPADRVLISESGTGALFLAVWLLCVPWSFASNALLYGWPGLVCGPGELLRGMFWASRQRPAWAKLPRSMRRPPAWMLLGLVLLAAGAVLVVSGSAAAGTDKGEVRILPGPRYEVSPSACTMRRGLRSPPASIRPTGPSSCATVPSRCSFRWS